MKNTLFKKYSYLDICKSIYIILVRLIVLVFLPQGTIIADQGRESLLDLLQTLMSQSSPSEQIVVQDVTVQDVSTQGERSLGQDSLIDLINQLGTYTQNSQSSWGSYNQYGEGIIVSDMIEKNDNVQAESTESFKIQSQRAHSTTSECAPSQTQIITSSTLPENFVAHTRYIFMSGSYVITQPIVIDQPCIFLLGSGDVTLIPQMIVIDGTPLIKISQTLDIVISGLRLDAQRSINDPLRYAIRIANSDQIFLFQSTIQGFKNGVWVDSQSLNVLIQDIGVRFNTFHGILDEGSGTSLINIQASNNTFFGVTLAGQYSWMSGGQFYGNTHGVYIDGASGAHLFGLLISGNSLDGVRIESGVARFTIGASWIDRNQAYAIHCLDTKTMLVLSANKQIGTIEGCQISYYQDTQDPFVVSGTMLVTALLQSQHFVGTTTGLVTINNHSLQSYPFQLELNGIIVFSGMINSGASITHQINRGDIPKQKNLTLFFVLPDQTRVSVDQRQIIVDKEGPLVSIISPLSGQQLLSGTITLQRSGQDSGVGLSGFDISLMSGTQQIISGSFTQTTLTTILTQTGDYILIVSGFDIFGNISTVIHPFSIIASNTIVSPLQMMLTGSITIPSVSSTIITGRNQQVFLNSSAVPAVWILTGDIIPSLMTGIIMTSGLSVPVVFSSGNTLKTIFFQLQSGTITSPWYSTSVLLQEVLPIPTGQSITGIVIYTSIGNPLTGVIATINFFTLSGMQTGEAITGVLPRMGSTLVGTSVQLPVFSSSTGFVIPYRSLTNSDLSGMLRIDITIPVVASSQQGGDSSSGGGGGGSSGGGSSGGGGGGGGVGLRMDICPGGDFSASYYDGMCGTGTQIVLPAQSGINLITIQSGALTPYDRAQLILAEYSGAPYLTPLPIGACSLVLPFSDVITHPLRQAIDILRCKGIIRGYSPTIFRPDNNITRAEFIKILVNTILSQRKEPLINEDQRFTGILYHRDVGRQDRFAGHIERAHQRGYLGFMERRFRLSNGTIVADIQPNVAITKNQAIRLLEAGLNIQGASPILYEYIKDAGVDISIDRNTFITRAQVAHVMAKAFDIQANGTVPLLQSNHVRFFQLIANALKGLSVAQQIEFVTNLISRMQNIDPVLLLRRLKLDRDLVVSDLRRLLTDDRMMFRPSVTKTNQSLQGNNTLRFSLMIDDGVRGLSSQQQRQFLTNLRSRLMAFTDQQLLATQSLDRRYLIEKLDQMISMIP